VNIEPIKRSSSHLPSDFAKEVEYLWHLRRQRDLASARIKLQKVLDTWFPAGLPPSAIELMETSQRLGAQPIVALLSFRCAVFRNLGETSESNKTLEILERFLLQLGRYDFFYYYYEHSQRALEIGNFQNALQHSVKMLELARSDAEKLAALIHKLICYENIGLDTDNLETQITELTQQKNDSLASRQQWKAYLARKFFRSGAFESYSKIEPEISPGQEAFHLAWVYQLPYMSHFQRLWCSEKAIQFAITHSRPYSLNTLLGIEDSRKLSAKLIERCDRLYLWTWRWITQAQNPRQSAAQVIDTFNEVIDHISKEDLTLEDRYLVTISALWLGFFGRHQRSRLLSFAERIMPQKTRGYEFFNLEYNLVSYLIAKDSHNTIDMTRHLKEINESQIKDSPLLPLIEFDLLRKKHENMHLIQLDNQIDIIFKATDSNLPPVFDCFVNVRAGHINIRNEKLIDSLLMAKAIRCLYGCQSRGLQIEDFYEQVFSKGIHQASNLRARTFTLLSQISRVFDKSISFHLVENTISQSGFWPKIFFNGTSLLSEELSRYSLPFGDLPTAAGTNEYPKRNSQSLRSLLIAIGSKPGVNRSELLKVMKIPKTSLRRLILRARREKKIYEKSKSGVSVYFLIQNEEVVCQTKGSPFV
jgi:hypothetical protein